MISVRKATVEDFEMLADLGRRAFYEAFAKYNDPGDMQAYLDLSFHPENIRKQLQDKDIIFFIASYHNDPVGYAKLRRNSDVKELPGKKCIQLERIYNLQAYIGKKVGKAMMEKCIEAAREEGYDYMWLGVWQENRVAIDFYNKWNFQTIGVKQFTIGKTTTDDFVMAIALKNGK